VAYLPVVERWRRRRSFVCLSRLPTVRCTQMPVRLPVLLLILLPHSSLPHFLSIHPSCIVASPLRRPN
jgi:hypothetical protein